MNTSVPRRLAVPAPAAGTARIWALPSSRPGAPQGLPVAAAGLRPPRPLAGPHRENEVRRRARGDAFGPVSPSLGVSVALAVCGRPDALPALVAALAAQRDDGGSPFARGDAEALVALVGEEAEVGAALAAAHPWLRTTVVRRLPAGAGPEWTCQLAMDAACVRLLAAGRPEGLVLTTARPPPPDWLARAVAEADHGADALAGPSHDLDAGLAVTARAYAHVGGLRVGCPSPGAALGHALADADAHVRRWPDARRVPARPALALTS